MTYYDAETGTLQNTHRDLDTGTGRYRQSDPIGLRGGINTYSYVLNNPLKFFDPDGLSPADVQGIWRDVLGSFRDLKPGSNNIQFKQPGGDGMGSTRNIDGQIFVPPGWAEIPCMTYNEYLSLFGTLFHESMHSSDSWFTRTFVNTNDENNKHHNTIYRRQLFEMGRTPRTNTPGSGLWGTPRDTPVDFQRLYDGYRKRTPACRC